MIDVSDEDTVPTGDHEALSLARSLLAGASPTVAQWAGGSTVGLVRPHNEDRWTHADGRFFVVADGMGGRSGGATAAQAVVDALVESPDLLHDVGAEAVALRANRAVLEARIRHDEPGASSTLVALTIHDGWATIANVGDSRCYLLRAGELLQLTKDHNVRTELREADIDPGEIGPNVRLDALTAYIGMGAHRMLVWTTSFEIEPGDRFLLCSDGVSGQVPARALVEMLQDLPPEAAVAAMLAAADDAGGRDNATAVVVEIGPSEVSG